MKTIFASALLAVVLLSSCASVSTQQVSYDQQKLKMHEINRTDYAKIDLKEKDKVESKRQVKYHSLANETDKKLNHPQNPDINKRRGADGSFGFY
jgi:PBP1b-binding outer membrane lipoprotein LpoB